MKALGWVFGIVVLLVIGGIAFVLFNSGGLIKSAMQELGPGYLGTSVTVESVDLALSEGTAEVRGLAIGNPSGFAGPHMLKTNAIKAILDLERTSESLVVLKQIEIDGADVAAVAQGKKTNFEKVLENLQKNTGSSSANTSSTAGQSETKFIVEKFDFTNAKASLNSDILGELELDIPDIHLADVGAKSNGASAAELAQELLKPISAAISKAVLNEGLSLDSVREGVEQRISDKLEEKLGSGFKGLTDRLRKKD